MPSVVAFTASGKRLVGEKAKRQAVTNAENTVRAPRRLIGRDPVVELRGRVYRAPELVAMVLEELKAAAEAALGHAVGKAVLSVPASFDDAARLAMREAGTLAGLEVVRIVNDPTAAAVAYGLGRGAGATLAVYDLGSGFDASVVR